MRRIFLLAGLLWFLPTVVVHAVPMGYISFDTLTPGSDGLNTFNINDLTGDPASGGSVFPSDFLVLDSLTLMDSRLLLSVKVIDGSPEVIPLNLMSSGPIPVGVLQFSATSFLLATFTARLNQTNLLLFDGSLFVAGSPFFSVVHFPASGSFLTAGSDFAVIDMAPVLEAGTWHLKGSGPTGLWHREGEKQAKRMI